MKKKPKAPKVARTRASGLWTEAKFWQFIRSALRSSSQKWPPRIHAKQARRRAYHGPNARQKWEYRCDDCGGWFKDKEVQMDHLEPCGPIRSFEDVGEFARRLYCEADGFALLCVDCHLKKPTGRNTVPTMNGRKTLRTPPKRSPPKPLRKINPQ